MSGFDDGIPCGLQGLEPAICRGLVAYLSPDAFLHVQPWLVAREVSELELSMGAEKCLYLRALMPSGSIHIQVDCVATKPATDKSQTVQESFSIPAGCPHQPGASEKRSHPPEDVQPLAMLAGCRDSQPLAPLRPSHRQARMQAEACFIFKDDSLPRPQSSQFFLAPSEISSRPRHALGCMNSLPASVDIPVDASNSALAALSALSHTDAEDAVPQSDHPIVPGLAQTHRALSLSPPPAAVEFSRSAALDAPDGSWASTPQAPVRLRCASTDLSSDASDPRPRQPIPDADPLLSATTPRSLCLCALREPPEQRLQDALDLPPDALALSLDFSCCQYGIAWLKCQITYCVCISVMSQK